MASANTAEQIEEITKISVPSLYKVILHNDNTTTMDFVVAVLVEIFHKAENEALDVTMDIHERGQGVAGAPYTKEIAEEKVHETVNFARRNGFPLVATWEEA